jgi:hypothetical protein
MSTPDIPLQILRALCALEVLSETPVPALLRRDLLIATAALDNAFERAVTPEQAQEPLHATPSIATSPGQVAPGDDHEHR